MNDDDDNDDDADDDDDILWSSGSNMLCKPKQMPPATRKMRVKRVF